MTQIYFSDFFRVPPQAFEEVGAFEVSLVSDLPLFVDLPGQIRMEGSDAILLLLP